MQNPSSIFCRCQKILLLTPKCPLLTVVDPRCGSSEVSLVLLDVSYRRMDEVRW